jgi:hypothetical protein
MFIPDPDFFPILDPYPGVKKAPDPVAGSAILRVKFFKTAIFVIWAETVLSRFGGEFGYCM